MDYSNNQQSSAVESSSNDSWGIGSLWSGITSGVKKITGSNDSTSNNNASSPNGPNTNPSAPIGGKRRRRKSMKGGNPKKGMKSRTRKGRKDFVTHKGDKYYHRKGKRQSRSRSGRKGRPYSRRSRK